MENMDFLPPTSFSSARLTWPMGSLFDDVMGLCVHAAEHSFWKFAFACQYSHTNSTTSYGIGNSDEPVSSRLHFT